LSTIFEYIDIKLTDMNRTSYSKHLEIDHKTLTKMKFILNEDGVWVAREQIGVHVDEEHKEKHEQPTGGNDEFVNMFATPPTTSFSVQAFGDQEWKVD